MRTPRLFLGIFVIALIVPLLMEIRPSRHPPARQGPGPGVVDPGRRPGGAGLGATRIL